MKTLFVAGARRGAGKTLVSEFLVRSLPGAAAVKVTCCRGDGPCPRGAACGVCGALEAPFAVIRDREVLAQPGKDTARLLAAGGEVLWLQAREQALAEGVRAALAALDGAPIVVVEGNAAFQAFPPDLGLLVIGSAAPPKPSVNVALPFVQGVVLNLRAGEAPPALVEGLPRGVRTFAFNAAAPDGDAEALVQWVRGRLSS